MKTDFAASRLPLKRLNVQPEPLLSFVVGHLQRTKGTWMEVSRESGVPYFTIAKLARGRTANPRIGTLQPLIDYFSRTA